MKRKKVYTFERTEENDEIIKKTKAFLGENTDSKTISWLLRWGAGRLFGKKRQ